MLRGKDSLVAFMQKNQYNYFYFLFQWHRSNIIFRSSSECENDRCKTNKKKFVYKINFPSLLKKFIIQSLLDLLRKYKVIHFEGQLYLCMVGLYFFLNFFIVIHSIVISMNVESLMSILERTPGDYEVFVKYADFEISLKDIVEVDISKKKLLLK